MGSVLQSGTAQPDLPLAEVCGPAVILTDHREVPLSEEGWSSTPTRPQTSAQLIRATRSHAQDNDRRAGTQTGHCALAFCHYWRATGGRRLTSSALKELTGTSIALSTIWRSRWLLQRDCRIDDPRGREAVFEHGT